MRRKLGLVLATVVALLFASNAAAGPDPHPKTIHLKVSVFNDALVPLPVLREAEARTRSVFEEAGVSLTWLDCGTPGNWHTDLGCRDVLFPTHLSVRLVSGPNTGRAEIFGQSFLNEEGRGSYAFVYLTPLSRAKALELVREGDLLGYVVVHELGHLLLGKNSHSAEGLMRAKWELAELREAARGKLSFSRSEAASMRARYWSAATPDRDEVSAELRSNGK